MIGFLSDGVLVQHYSSHYFKDIGWEKFYNVDLGWFRSCSTSIIPLSYLSLFSKYFMFNSNDFELGLFKVISGQSL